MCVCVLLFNRTLVGFEKLQDPGTCEPRAPWTGGLSAALRGPRGGAAAGHRAVPGALGELGARRLAAGGGRLGAAGGHVHRECFTEEWGQDSIVRGKGWGPCAASYGTPRESSPDHGTSTWALEPAKSPKNGTRQFSCGVGTMRHRLETESAMDYETSTWGRSPKDTRSPDPPES